VPPVTLRADEPADDSARPYFEREWAIETAFRDIWAARTAARSVRGGPQAGAVAVVPTVVFACYAPGSGCGAAGQWPLELSHPPGTLFHPGRTTVSWRARVGTAVAEGAFTVAVGTSATASWAKVDGRPVDAPFGPVELAELDRAGLAQAARRLERAAEDARGRIMELTAGLLHKVVARFAAHFCAAFDADDAFQEAARETLRLAERFASEDRPAASWGRAVAMAANRNVAQALARSQGMGRPELAVQRLLAERPELARAPTKVLRAALEARVAEAARWSDRRIDAAAAGVPRIEPLAADDVRLAAEDPEPWVDGGVAEILGGVLPPAASAWLAAKGVLDGSPAAAAGEDLGAGRRQVLALLSRRLGVAAGTARQLAEAFAVDGERYDDPAARRRMVRRAQDALGRLLDGAGG